MSKKNDKRKSNWRSLLWGPVILVFTVALGIGIPLHYGALNAPPAASEAPKTAGESYAAATKEYDLSEVLPSNEDLPDGTKRIEEYVDDGDDNVFTSENNPMGFHWKEVIDETLGTENNRRFPIADKDGRELVFEPNETGGVYRYADDNSYVGTSEEIMTKVTLTEYLDGTIG